MEKIIMCKQRKNILTKCKKKRVKLGRKSLPLSIKRIKSNIMRSPARNKSPDRFIASSFSPQLFHVSRPNSSGVLNGKNIYNVSNSMHSDGDNVNTRFLNTTRNNSQTINNFNNLRIPPSTAPQTDNSPLSLDITSPNDRPYSFDSDVFTHDRFSSSSNSPFEKSLFKNSCFDNTHENAIASALGLGESKRILNFNSPVISSPTSSSDHRSPVMKLDSPISPKYSFFNNTPFGKETCNDFYINSLITDPSQVHSSPSRTVPNSPLRVLDAPGLRDDFYSSLVSWSKINGLLAVGLSYNVYIWKEEKGALSLPHSSYSPVTCLSFSNSSNNILAVGRLDGSLTCWDSSGMHLCAEYTHSSGICFITWMPTTKRENLFVVGDEKGNILFFEIKKITEEANQLSRSIIVLDTPVQWSLVLIGSVRAHFQQICGLAFSPDGSQLASGGNDNTCTVWDMPNIISEATLPTEPRYKWEFNAAVKALTFCPSLSSLLATGGGSNDRTIRFWHTHSGTLINTIDAEAQVTSLTWSLHSKEIMATFGYANPENSCRMALYSFPRCSPITKIPWAEDVRALYAVQSPDGSSICVASSDETIRFYKVWTKFPLNYPNGLLSGPFGSDIIELHEGIDKEGIDLLR